MQVNAYIYANFVYFCKSREFLKEKVEKKWTDYSHSFFRDILADGIIVW